MRHRFLILSYCNSRRCAQHQRWMQKSLYLPSLEMSGSGPALRYSFLYPGQCCSIRHGENTDWHQGSTFWEGGGIMKSERKRVEEGCCQRLGSDYQPFMKANRKRSIATAHSVLRSSQMLGWWLGLHGVCLSPQKASK